jgi:hypothetical protein
LIIKHLILQYISKNVRNITVIIGEYLQNLLPQWTFIPLENLKGELDQDFAIDIQNEFNTTSLLKWKHLGILLNDDCKMHKLSDVSNFYDLSCVYRIRY